MESKNETFGEIVRFFRWKPAACLRISGEDSFTFLQGQFTNDLRELKSGGSVYGLWLNHKGRVLADSFVIRQRDGAFLIASYFSSAAVIQQRLEAFVIADDVVIEDLTNTSIAMSILGKEPAEFVDKVLPGVRFTGRRGDVKACEWIYPTQDSERVDMVVGGMTEISAEEHETLRIRGLVPAVPIDIGPGELPNEGALEGAAISYTKGCYLGQEVMARLKSMGQVRRQLMRVRGRTLAPALPAALFQGDKKIGELRSAVEVDGGIIGLALLSLLNLQREQSLSFAPGAEGVLVLDPSS